jgi:DNA helicase-2/ATP-dependent DNA helicase PcrA
VTPRNTTPGEGQLGLDIDLPQVVRDAPDQAPTRPALRGEPLSARQIADLLGRPAPTDEQAAVIEAPMEPMLVIAGAGSGKTETMAARVVWLVANGWVHPDQILGLTFTRKAAGELAERVRARLRGLHRKRVIEEPRPVTVATYHSYAAGVLGDHALRLGVEPGAQLLGEAGAWQLVDELVERWDGDMSGVESARVTVVDAVLALAGECAEHLLEPDRIASVLDDVLERVALLPAKPGDAVPGRPKADVAEIGRRMQARRRLLPLVEAYRRRKQELELLDFGDQVALAARLARDVPEVGAGERERYRIVLLDEYQDTSHAQVVLLRSLFGGGHPVIAVGDPHQSIYAWRGASAGTLQRFKEVFPHADGGPAVVRQLATSWRNDEAVLQVANTLAGPLRRPAPWVRTGPDHVTVQPLAARPGAGPGRVRIEWHDTVDAEARAVADIVHHSWHDPKPDGGRRSIAVLCRARSQFPLLEAAMRAKGLPVEVVGLGGLLHVPEIADLRAALQVVHDPTRGDALMRLLTGPAWRIGPRDLDGLGAWARHRARWLRVADDERAQTRPDSRVVEVDSVDETSVVDALDDLPAPDWAGPQGEEISEPGLHRLGRLATVLRGLRSRVRLPLPDLVLEAERALLLDVEVASRAGRSPAAARAHLDAFIDVAAAFSDGGERPTLGGFLGWLDAAEAQERGLDAGVVEQHEDAVQLLTVHGSKGLEWDVVAVAGLVEGTFPAGTNGNPPRLSKGWLSDLGAVPFPLRGDADGLPHWEFGAATTQPELAAELKVFMQRCGEHEVAEERRLAYVAVTRARESLLLTGAIWADGVRPRQPSRFLTEVRDGGVAAVGLWSDEPDEGAQNPREVDGRTAPWPVELPPERLAVLQGAAHLVHAAAAAQAADADAPAGAAAEDAAPGDVASEDTAAQDVADPDVAAQDTAAQDIAAQDVAPEDIDLRDEPVREDDVAPDDADPDESAWARELDLLLAERDEYRRSHLVVRLPAHLSASRVVALAGDPAGLAQRLRRPMPAEPSPAARRGSTFHAWLEQRFSAAALVDVDELPGAGDDPDTTDDAELERLKARFLASEWAGREAEAVEVAVETPVGDVMLRGRIDAVFRRGPEAGGGWDVVDWKTGAPPSGERAAALAVQLAVYRLAWSRLHDVPAEQVSAAFFYASTGTTVRPVDLLGAAELEGLIRSATETDTGPEEG